MAFTTGALLLLLGTTAWAVPVPGADETRCATRCPFGSKFGFETGHTYNYRYSADVTTSMVGASEEHSSLRMSSDVGIEVLSRCEFNLKLSGVSLHDTSNGRADSVDGSSEFAQSLQERPLRFAFVDGAIVDVCPEPEEHAWTLNIKKALLSIFQNEMHDLSAGTRGREVDLSGECDVTYDVLGSGHVRKTKDIPTCDRHHHIHSVLQHAPFTSDAFIKTAPVFDITNECEQTFDSNNIHERIECHEVHKLNPFSSGDNGATTDVVMTMARTGQSSGVTGTEGAIHRRDDLMFDHIEQTEESHVNSDSARQLLRDMCTETETDVRPTVPGLFMKLVKTLKKLDVNDLTNLHNDANSFCTKAHNFFHDAVPNIKTAASLTVIKNMLQSGEVTGRTAELWITSLAFLEDTPTPDMLPVAFEILQLDTTSHKAALSVASLFHSYCTKHPDCEREQSIASAIGLFTEQLRYNCRSTNDDRREEVLLALKALGNMGYAQDTVPTLMRCINNDEAPMALRVAAISAFRRMPCQVDTPEMLRIMEDANMDVELRINAYEMLMKCPSPAILERVRSMLAHEEINQVGSYVWTHLTNLMETESHYKQEVRSILQDEVLVNTFDLDKRKFSRNIELSALNDKFNIGGQLESNLIWSPSSFAPRSMNLNLTADVFGHSINFLEVGGRIEGVEKVIENVFKDKEMNEVLENDYGTDTMTQAMENTRAQVFMRIFGNELRYQDFQFSDLTHMQDQYNYLEFLMNLAEEHGLGYTRSMVLISEELVHPTAAGLPLNLGIHGAATTHVQITGHLDLRNAFASPRSVDILGSIRPSGALEITGEMGVDAFVASTGLKMVTSLHTSTVADVNVQLQNDRIFSMDINMPDQSSDIITVRSQLYLTKRSQDVELNPYPEDVYTLSKCSCDTTATITGLELCAELSYPRVFHQSNAPWFPLTGTSQASLVLNKRDTFTGYHFETRLLTEGDAHVFRVAFDTPGSSVNRQMSIDFNMNQNEKTASLLVLTPWKKADLNVAYTESDEMKSLTSRAVIDDSRNYGINLNMGFVQNRLNVEYSPRLEILLHGVEPKVVSGTVLYRAGRRVQLDLSFENIFSTTAGINADLKKIANSQRERYETTFGVTSPVFTGSIESHMEKQLGDSPVYTSRAELQYQVENNPQQTFVFTNKLRDSSTAARSDYQLETSLSSTKWPKWDYDHTITFTREGIAFSVSVDAGSTSRARRRISAAIAHTSTVSGATQEHGISAHLRAPSRSVDWQLNGQVTKTGANVGADITANYNGDEAHLQVSTERLESPDWMVGEITLTYPGRHFMYRETLDRRTDGDHHSILIQLDHEDQVTINSVFVTSPDYHLTVDASLPYLDPIQFTGHLRPVREDFSGQLQVSYADTVYGGSLAWSRDGDQITSECRLHLGAYEVQEVVTTLDVSVVDWSVGPSFRARMQWTGDQFVELNGRHMDTHQGWWSETRNMEGSLEFTSSLAGYETSGVSYTHDQDPTTVNTGAQVWWASNKRIEVSVTNSMAGTSGESTWDIRTPFSIEHIVFTRSFTFENNQVAYSGSLQLDDQVTTFAMNGQLDLAAKSMDATMEITSPYQGYETITTSFGFSLGDQEQTLFSHSSWSGNNNFNLDLTMSSARDGWHMDYSGTMDITTTIVESFSNGHITWEHHTNADGVNIEYNVANGDDALFKWKIQGAHSTEGGQKQVNGEIELEVGQWVDFQAELNHAHEARHMRSMATTANIEWAENQSINFRHELSRQPRRGTFSQTLRVTHPFSFSQIDVSTEASRTDNTYTTHTEIRQGVNDRIVIDSTVTPGWPAFDANLHITTPYEAAERILVEASNALVEGVWNARSVVDYGTDSRYELTGSLGMDATKEFGVGVKTPSTVLTDFSVSGMFEGQMRDFRLGGGFKVIPHLPGDYQYNLEVKTLDVEDIKVESSLTTPEPFRHVLFTHQLVDGHYVTDMDYLLTNSIHVVAHHDLELNWPQLYHSTATLDWQDGEPVELDIHLILENRKDMSVVLRVPPSVWENHDFQFTMSHEGNRRTFQSSIAASINGNNVGGASVDFSNLADAFSLTANVNCIHLSTRTQNVELTITHTHPWNNFRNQITFNAGPSMTYSTDTTFEYSRLATTLVSTITTPHQNYETITINYATTNTRDRTEMTRATTITYGGNTITENMEITRSRRNGNLHYHLTTPYAAVSTLDVQIDHSGRWDNMEDSFTIEHNGNTYTGATTFRKTARAIRGSATVSIPETYAVEFNHKGFVLTDWSNTAEYRTPAQRYAVNSNFRIQGKSVEAGASVNIPEEYGASFTHAGPITNFQHNGEVIVQGKHYNGNAEFRYRGDTLTASAGYAVPAESKEYSASFNKEGPMDNVQVNSNLNLNGEVYEARASYTETSDSYTGSASCTCPNGGYSTGFTLTGLPNNAELSAQADINGDEYTLSGTYSNDDTTMETTGNLHTPHQGYDNFGFTARHSATNGHEVSASVTTPFAEYENNAARMTYRPRSAGFTTVGNIETSHSLVQQIGFEVDHEGSLADFRTSGSITHPQHSARFSVNHAGNMQVFTSGAMMEYNARRVEGEISSSLVSAWQSADYELSIRLATPFEDLRSVELTLTNRMQPQSGEGELNVHHNGEHLVDLDFNAAMGSNSNLVINIREPVSSTFTLNVATSETEETAGAVLVVDGERYTMDVTLRAPEQYSRSINVVFNTPHQQFTFSTGYTLTDVQFTHHVEVTKGTDTNDRFHYAVEATKTQRSARQIYEGSINVESGADTYRGTVYHKWNPGRAVQTTITIEDYTFRHDVTIRQPGLQDFQSVLTISHAERNRNLVITTNGAINTAPFSAIGTIHIAPELEAGVELYGKLADESPSEASMMYVAESSFTFTLGSTVERSHFIGQLYNSEEKVGVNTEATLETSNHDQRVVNAKLELLKLDPTLIFESDNLDYDVSLHLHHVADDDENHHLELTGHLDHVPIQGELDIASDKGLDAKLYYQGNMGRIHGQMLTPSTASFEIYHEMDGEKTEDVVLSVRMNDTRLMHGRAHMRPTLFDDYNEIIPSEETTARLYQAMSRPQEIVSGHLVEINEGLQPAQEIFVEMQQDYSAKLDELRATMEQLYEDNAFHSRDIVDYFREQGQEFSDLFDEMAQSAVEHMNRVQEYMPVSSVMGLAPTSYSQDIADWWTSTTDTASEAIIDAFEAVRDHPTTQDVMERWNQLRSMEVNTDFLDDLNIDMQPHTDNLVEMYNEAMVDLRDAWNDLMERPEMALARDSMEDLQETAVWALDYYGINQKVQALQEAREQGLHNIVATIQRRIKDYLQLNRTRVTVWQPENWEVQAEAYLPFEVRDLETLATYPERARQYIVEMQNRITNYVPNDRWAVWDTVYAYKPRTTNLYEWMPPFSSHATIAGNQHFMTFDRHFYEYAGECSYVLARDMIDGLFSVIVTYDTARNERSITVNVDDHTIEVAPGYKVHIDGIRTEMPVMVGETTVMRVGHVVRVDSPHGFTALCDLPNNRCTVNVTGWYYGKTGGLMGTFDNEPFTDFQNPSGEHMENVASLADSWTEGNRCRVSNLATEASLLGADHESEHYQLCARYFMESDSVFRPCFMQVNHTEFMQMCFNDLMRNPSSTPSEADVCDVAAFYTDECERAGVAVRMPTACVSCELPNGDTFLESEPQTIEGSDVPQSADVVLVVSMSSCNSEIIPKLQDIVNRLDTGLNAHGLESNRFALVGYGGEGAIYGGPHSHTMDGQLFASKTKYTQAVENFPLHETMVEDGLAALEFAARYPYRAGVGKSVIVIPCFSCEEFSFSYSDVQSILVDRDIKLSMLMQSEFRVDKTDPATSYIFGVDRTTVYTRRDFGDSNPQGDPALRPQVAVPKDLCTALTDLSNGTLFNSRHLIEGRSLQQKKFLDVMSTVVAIKARPPQCQTCDCLAPEGSGVPTTVCRSCNQPDPFFSLFPDLIENFDDLVEEADATQESNGWFDWWQ